MRRRTGSVPRPDAPAGRARGRQAGLARARHRLRLARDWISAHRAPPRARTLVVHPSKAGTRRVRRPPGAPDCRRVGRFRVRADQGVNRVRSPASGSVANGSAPWHVQGRRREQLPTGPTVGHTRLVVVDRASRGEIRAARRQTRAAPTSSVGRLQTPLGQSRRPELLSDPARRRRTARTAAPSRRAGAQVRQGAVSPPETFRSESSSCDRASESRCSQRAAASPAEPRPWACPRRSSSGLVGASILLGLTVTYAFT